MLSFVLFLATTASLVQARPHSGGPPQAIDSEQASFYEPSVLEPGAGFGATCWGSATFQGPACAVFANLGRNFQEYINHSPTSGNWQCADIVTPSRHYMPPSSDTPMTALSSYDFGGQDIAIFWPVQQRGSWYLMSSYKSMDGRWETEKTVAGTSMTQGGSPPTFMTNVVWQGIGGKASYSVWWNDADGNVFRFRRDENGMWNNDGQLGENIQGAFSVSLTGVTNGGADPVYHIFTSGGQRYTATGNTLPGLNVDGAASAPMPGMAGSVLPWGFVQSQFYFVGAGNLITESYVNAGNWVNNHQQYQMYADGGNGPVVTAFWIDNGVHTIHVFARCAGPTIKTIDWVSTTTGTWSTPVDIMQEAGAS